MTCAQGLEEDGERGHLSGDSRSTLERDCALCCDAKRLTRYEPFCGNEGRRTNCVTNRTRCSGSSTSESLGFPYWVMAISHADVVGVLSRHGYTQLKRVGEGSFGQAILVQGQNGERLICKMVDVSKASSKEMQDAQKESRLLAALNHRYIVRYRENFFERGWICILMDFCEGGDPHRADQASTKAESLH